MVSTSMRGLRLFLADDHIIVRQGLKAILEQEGFEIVGEASDGRSAVLACATLKPAVAILDLAMPLLNGIDAARGVLKHCPETKVVVLTVYSEASYVLAGLRAGVKGFVLKTNAASSLVQAIEAVMNSDSYLSPGVAQAVVQAILSNEVLPLDRLSTREREVLQLLAEGKNVKEIGDLLGISARTAETHRARIMGKLNIHEIAGLVRYAIEHHIISVERRPRWIETVVDTPLTPTLEVGAD
jgi:DNA-binding NarL/FixJ family response regulator